MLAVVPVEDRSQSSAIARSSAESGLAIWPAPWRAGRNAPAVSGRTDRATNTYSSRETVSKPCTDFDMPGTLQQYPASGNRLRFARHAGRLPGRGV